MKRLVIDLDYTLSHPRSNLSNQNESGNHLKYEEAHINTAMAKRLKDYKAQGFEILIFSARNMNTYNGQIGLINVHTLPRILNWLDKNDIIYDEVVVGKPWCGNQGFYVDDRAVRPLEFMSLTLEQIQTLLEKERFNEPR